MCFEIQHTYFQIPAVIIYYSALMSYSASLSLKDMPCRTNVSTKKVTNIEPNT